MQTQQGKMYWAPVSVLSIYAVAICGSTLKAQTAGTPQSIEQKISAQYTPTKATADHSDIVTAGAVIVLKKDGLIMTSTTSGAAAANVYKDGRITSSGALKTKKVFDAWRNRSLQGGGDTRTFVAGEKFWVTICPKASAERHLFFGFFHLRRPPAGASPSSRFQLQVEPSVSVTPRGNHRPTTGVPKRGQHN
jgi:hypothetical protein